MAELILKDEVYAIAGSAMDVYYTMGTGFLEPVYHAAMIVELGVGEFLLNPSASLS